jgi:hypothetical protein
MAQNLNLYSQLIETIFFRHFQEGVKDFAFDRFEISATAEELGLKLPKNIGDVLYTFRYRKPLPTRIRNSAPTGFEWTIRSAGIARYTFVLVPEFSVTPSPLLAETKILDATPGVISRYALTDEQALLAKLRYNRLIDIFTALTCYSLQNHLRTTVADLGQVETDEIYIGLDRRGVHYVIPVQAKGGRDKIGRIQIEQDFAMCAEKFSGLICLPIATQFMANNVIALFAFEYNQQRLAISTERHYRLVRPEELSAEELASYRARTL